MMITVYVPITYLKNISQFEGDTLPKPSEFWLTRPDTWMSSELGTISVSPQTWASWNHKINDSKTSSKQLLKD